MQNTVVSLYRTINVSSIDVYLVTVYVYVYVCQREGGACSWHVCTVGAMWPNLSFTDAEEDFQQDLPSELEVYAGEDGIFTCLPPQANPPFLNWTWFKGLNESKVMLQSVSGNVTVNGARLTIHSAMSEDAGFYSCSVDNGHFNRTSRNSQLKVLAREFVHPECVNYCVYSSSVCSSDYWEVCLCIFSQPSPFWTALGSLGEAQVPGLE